MTRHYHVGNNIPGYLPDNTYRVETKRDAQKALAEEVRRYRDEQWQQPSIYRRTGEGSAYRGDVFFKNRHAWHDLGIHFWWSVCQDDCPEEND